MPVIGCRVMKAFISALLVSAFLCSSCATVYQGPVPNLSKQGPEAQSEIENFTLKESIWSGRLYSMGPQETRYLNLDTVIASVSPRAIEKINAAQKWNIGATSSLLVSLGLVIAAIFTDHRRTTQTIYWSAAGFYGAAWGLGMTANSKFKSAARMYNEDLRTKLGPRLGVSFKF